MSLYDQLKSNMDRIADSVSGSSSGGGGSSGGVTVLGVLFYNKFYPIIPSTDAIHPGTRAPK